MVQHSFGGLLALQHQMQKQHEEALGVEGVIVAGSYNPADGTVQAIICHTVAAAAFQDPGNPPQQVYPAVVGAQLETSGYGDQYGPVGGERCILRKAGTHFTAHLEHNSDDSPGAPSGERWSVHYVPSSVPTGARTINAYLKLTNDGASGGDGHGGFRVLAGGLGSITTGGGINLSLNDTTATASLTGAASVLISATGGGSIAISGTQVIINGATVGVGSELVRQSDLVALLAALQTALAAWASSSLQGGSGAGGPTLSFVPTASSKTYSA
jgi:hypothetical protein